LAALQWRFYFDDICNPTESDEDRKALRGVLKGIAGDYRITVDELKKVFAPYVLARRMDIAEAGMGGIFFTASMDRKAPTFWWGGIPGTFRQSGETDAQLKARQAMAIHPIKLRLSRPLGEWWGEPGEPEDQISMIYNSGTYL